MSRQTIFKFRLYVAGDAQNAALALANIRAMCLAHAPGRHEIEVVDVFRHPKRALADGIFMTPTLVRLLPLPTRRIVGTLSQTGNMAQLLGLAGEHA